MRNAPSFPRGVSNFNWATSYSPTHLARAVPSGLKGLTSVFGMGTGGTPSLGSPKICLEFFEYLTGYPQGCKPIASPRSHQSHSGYWLLATSPMFTVKFYGQA